MADLLTTLKVKIAELDQASAEDTAKALKEIEALVAEQAASIPRYTARQIEELLHPVRERAKKSKVKSSFAFKSAPTPSEAKPARIENTKPQEAHSDPVSSAKLSTMPLCVADREKFGGKDMFYQGLEGETILVSVPSKALTLDGLNRCRVFVLSAIESSIVVRDCHECEIHCRAAQVRIHSTTKCEFHLFCATDPIIEKSSGLVFHPCRLKVSEEEMPGHPEWANPDANKFSNVRDFNWLKPQASPNFTISNSDERPIEPLEAHGQSIRFV
jgi:hypothetical protein